MTFRFFDRDQRSVIEQGKRKLKVGFESVRPICEVEPSRLAVAGSEEADERIDGSPGHFSADVPINIAETDAVQHDSHSRSQSCERILLRILFPRVKNHGEIVAGHGKRVAWARSDVQILQPLTNIKDSKSIHSPTCDVVENLFDNREPCTREDLTSDRRQHKRIILF